jgi:hypothetical protein
MQKQRTMWETLRDRIGQAQSEYANFARDSQGNLIDTGGLEGLQKELLNVAQAALNSGAITTSTYNEIAEMFNDDNWSESELIAAYDALQSNIEETDIDIANAKDGMDDLQQSYNDAERTVMNLEGATEELGEATHNASKKTKEEIGAIDDSANSTAELAEEKKAVKEATEETTEATDKETKSIDLNKEANAELRAETVERSKANRTLAQTQKEIEEALKSATDAVHEQAEAEKTLRDAAQQARDDMSQAFEDIKKSVEDAFKVNPFDQWQQDTEKGMLAFEEAMLSQRDGLLRYKDNLTTVKDNLGEVAPEFVQYLEDMGAGGAQLVAEFADAFRTGNADTVYRLMDEYKQAMDIQDDVTGIIEQDKLALQLGLESLSPEAIHAWEDLGFAFDEGVEVLRVKGEELTQTTSDSFWQAVDIAKSVGMEVPKGLADSIRNSENPEQAIADATLAINEGLRGRGEELLTAANELGINVPTGISSAILNGATGEELQTAVSSLVETIRAKQPDFDAAGAEAGAAAGDATAAGITNKGEDVSGAATGVVESAKESASTATDVFKLVGNAMPEAMVAGINEKPDTLSNRLGALIAIAKNRAKSKVDDENGSFRSLGSYMVEQLTAGMRDGHGSFVGELDSLNIDVGLEMQTMQGTISSALTNIQTAFATTQLSFPHVAIPHVSWDWRWLGYGDGGGTYWPDFKVDWYAKAMEQGMILNNPTIFGAMNGKLLGGGESGSETVVGTGSLMSMIQTAVSDAAGVNIGTINIPIQTMDKVDAKSLARQIEPELARIITKRGARF